MTWQEIAPLDRAGIALGGCILLLAAGLLRAWMLAHRLHAQHNDLVTRIDDQKENLGELRRRLDRIQNFSDAQQADARSQHDGDVVEMLGSLLQLNEALRRPAPREAAGRPHAEPPGSAT